MSISNNDSGWNDSSWGTSKSKSVSGRVGWPPKSYGTGNTESKDPYALTTGGTGDIGSLDDPGIYQTQYGVGYRRPPDGGGPYIKGPDGLYYRQSTANFGTTSGSSISDMLNSAINMQNSALNSLSSLAKSGGVSSLGSAPTVNWTSPSYQAIDTTLPQAYKDAYEEAINYTTNKSVGSAINDMASRGVVNSSVTNKGLSDISDAASAAAANGYNSAMQTYTAAQAADRNYQVNLSNLGLEAALANANNATNWGIANGQLQNQAAQNQLSSLSLMLQNAALPLSTRINTAQALQSYGSDDDLQQLYLNWLNSRYGTGTTTTTTSEDPGFMDFLGLGLAFL